MQQNQVIEPNKNAVELPATPVKVKKPSRFSNRNSMLAWKKDGWKALLALAPAMIILLVFTLYPIVNTFAMSFFPKYDYINGVWGGFGFDNFAFILRDQYLWKAIGNTLVMVIVSVPLSIIVALVITVLLNSIKKLQGVYQVIFFLPYVTNGIAFGLVFRTIFAPTSGGLVNSVLSIFGMDPVFWTGSVGPIPYWAGIIVITVNAIWNGLAFKILVFLSGLQGIDKQYYQAAQIDATPKGRVFRKITVPLLSPMILYITITSMIGAFKSYSSVVSLFGEDMSDWKFITAVGYIYKYFNTVDSGVGNNISKAAAAAVVLFILILLITIAQMAYNKRRVHY